MRADIALATAAAELAAECEAASHGSAYQRARQVFLQRLVTDPNQPAHVRGWIANQLRQQARRGGRLRGIPGMDVGHKPRRHGQEDPDNYRLEWARDNRLRPHHAHRLWPHLAKRDLPIRELEQELADAASEMDCELRGQAGRAPARHLLSRLRHLGFQPTGHFMQRVWERAQAQGIRLDPRTFAQGFRQGQHLRQDNPAHPGTRVVVVQGLPVVYAMSGARGATPRLVTLLPQGAVPAGTPVPAPALREADPFA